MKVLLMSKPGDVKLTEIPTPEPKENEVLIKVMAAGICTNDVRDYKGDCNYSYPRIGGHEYCGVIEKMGAGVDPVQFAVGQRVVSYIINADHSCHYCRTGHENICFHHSNSYIFHNENGISGYGGFGEYVIAKAEDLFVYSDTTSFEKMAFTEPLACVVNSINRTNIGVSFINKFISTGSPAANLLWVKENESDKFEKLAHFLIGPDYLVYRMTGIYGTDFCEASTSSLYDLMKKEWSPEMREIVGLPESVYPQVRGSAEIVGTVTVAIAEQFGLNPKTKVIVGTGDNPAAAIPTGCLGSEYPVFSLGTSGVLMFPREAPDFDAKGKNILFSFDGEKCYTMVQGVIQSCGSGYNWWNREILEQDFNGADKDIDIDHLGENPLIFYPHLVGDKNIYADPDLRGAFLGLSTDTTRSDMTQAIMEGIAFGLKQLVEAMKLKKEKLLQLKVIGGGSKSRVWMQILADVLNSPVEQMEGNAGAGYGMALLAAYSCGQITSLSEIANQSVSIKERFEPRKYNAELYAKKYKQYLRIHDAMKDIFAD